MKKIGLALSGGGFRATLYHLGLARFLHDAGLLSKVTHVTSVSGGSIFAAHLLLNWGRVLASGAQKEIRSDLKNWSEELSIQCDAPERLARRLFDAGVLLGFDLDGKNGLLQIRVKDASDFYARWTDLLLESQVTIYAIRSQSRSLKNIFDKVTS